MTKKNLAFSLVGLVLMGGISFVISGCAKETKEAVVPVNNPVVGDVTQEVVVATGMKNFDGQFYSFEYPANYTVKDQTSAYKVLRVFDEKNKKVLEIYNDNDLMELGEAPADEEDLEATSVAGFGEGEKRYAAILFSPMQDVVMRELLFKIIDSAVTK
jgi:hypothetical protein